MPRSKLSLEIAMSARRESDRSSTGRRNARSAIRRKLLLFERDRIRWFRFKRPRVFSLLQVQVDRVSTRLAPTDRDRFLQPFVSVHADGHGERPGDIGKSANGEFQLEPVRAAVLQL